MATDGSLRDSLPGSGCAIAVLRRQGQHRRCVEEWDTWAEYLAWLLPCCRGLLGSRPQFRGTHALRIRRAENASDMFWENLNVPEPERARARLKTYGALAVIFALTGLALYLVKRVDNKYKPGAWSTYSS